MKAILINPRYQSVTEVEVNAGSAEDLARLLHCRWVYPLTIDPNNLLYSSAVSLSYGEPFWVKRHFIRPYRGVSEVCGMAVITGCDDMGRPVDTTYTIEQVKAIVSFTCPVEENS